MFGNQGYSFEAVDFIRRMIVDPVEGETAVYTAADTAKALGKTPKTIVAWTRPGDGIRPELRAWPPRSENNPSRTWLIDADQVDELRDQSRGPMRSAVESEQQRLADDRALVEMDRSLLQQERSELLVSENARLVERVRQLEMQNEELGQMISRLTRRASV